MSVRLPPSAPTLIQRPRSPVRGEQAPEVSTQGAASGAEHVAAHKLDRLLDPRDLDVFLRARQGQKQKGLLPSLKRALNAGGAGAAVDPSQQVAVHQVRDQVGRALRTLFAVYADGRDTEGELDALSGARKKLQAVLQLATPEVLDMLPRDTRERLQENLFEPLAIIEAAAGRRGDRVIHAIAARDEGALHERLMNPQPRYALFHPAEEARAGRPLVTPARFKPGDLVAVPRSGGGSTLGVVVANMPGENSLRVEFRDAKSGAFAVKTLSAGELLQSNPLKIGDYLEIDDKQIWVKGVGQDGRLEAVVKTAGEAQTKLVGGADFAAITYQASSYHSVALQLEQLPGMQVVPAVTRRLARFALDVGPSDKVFGRLCRALTAALAQPAVLGATPMDQAKALTSLLRDEPAHLHGVIPNFRTERDVALVSQQAIVQGSGPHPLMRLLPGAPVPGHVVHQVTFHHGDRTHTLTVVEPQPPPPAPPGKRHASMTEVVYNLAKLPFESLAEIKSVVVNPNPDPGDAYWQKEFKDPTHAAYMTADKKNRTLTIYPAHDFVTMELSLAHEVGHFVGNATMGDPARDPRWKQWDNAVKSDNLSVSRYAKNNLDEDFAETYSLYTMTKGTPAHAKYRGLMPLRFALLDQLTDAAGGVPT